MTMLELVLLGEPRAIRDGRAVHDVRGAKVWALLAVLLLAERPVARAQLGSLLFADAVDPAASLRWNLSQLRRGVGVGVEGDPVELVLPHGTWCDLQILADGEAAEAATVAMGARPLLDGISFGDHQAISVWLEGERRHLLTLAADVLREAALGSLTAGNDAGEAVRFAERVLQLAPFDENAAVLLVRALREAGRASEAITVAEATAVRIRAELGVEPSAALWSAAHAPMLRTAGGGGRTAIAAQLEAGEAALSAGIPDAGLDALRGALGGARALGELELSARCLVALGSALIHAVRGSDQDGIALLHEAVPLAAAAELADVSARAHRELGYVDLLRGRYRRAQRWFSLAAVHAAGDDQELAWIGAWAGAARTDTGDQQLADELLDEAVGRSNASRSLRAAATTYTMRGRSRLLANDDAGANEDLERAVQIARDSGWRSFKPWPQTLQAEIVYRHHDLAGAAAILRPALATSRQVNDPCWEAMALRGLGLTTVADGDIHAGIKLLEQSPRQCRRLPDTYLWVEAYGLDALADTTSRRGLPQAESWIQQLDDISTSHGMRNLSRNAAHYRTR